MNKPTITDDKKLHEILARSSRSNHQPFTVPQGYFNDLQPRVMAKIRQTADTTDAKDSQWQQTCISKQDNTLFAFLRHSIVRLSAAAVLVGVFAITGTILYKQMHTTDTLSTESFLSLSAFSDAEDYGDELLDYAMLDNSDIEYYLTSAD